MYYNIVTNLSIIQEIKKSKHYKVHLGFSSTLDKAGHRVLNAKDQFALFYNNRYRTTIYSQGTVGDIQFYIDYYIREPRIALYVDDEEYIFDYNPGIIQEKGIDFYLGSLLKEADVKDRERKEEVKARKENSKKVANPESLLKSPGSVTFDDIKSYMEMKNKERYDKEQ